MSAQLFLQFCVNVSVNHDLKIKMCLFYHTQFIILPAYLFAEGYIVFGFTFVELGSIFFCVKIYKTL